MPAPAARPADEPGTYELRVAGELGPALLAALPHTSATRVRGRTVLVVQADRQDLVEVLERIVRCGLEVDSVRDVTRRAEATGDTGDTGATDQDDS